MNSWAKKIYFISLILAVFFIDFNGKKARRTPLWTACYQSSSNRLHFQNLGTKMKRNGNCVGQTRLSGPRGYRLIENKHIVNGFGESRVGTKRAIRLKDGRLILVAQFEKKGRPNRLIVAEPKVKSQRVISHCVFSNHLDLYNTVYDRRTRSLKVQIADGNRTNFIWKSCRL